MKKLYLFLTIATFFAATSCKKGGDDKNDGDSFMKFKMDGAQINWTDGFAEHSSVSLEVINANGFSSNQSGAETMTVTIANDGPINLNQNYSYPDFNVRINYYDANDIHYTADDYQATVKITSETTGSISGTFSGKIKSESGQEKIITDGTFVLEKNN